MNISNELNPIERSYIPINSEKASSKKDFMFSFVVLKTLI